MANTNWKRDEELSMFTGWFKSIYFWVIFLCLGVGAIIFLATRGAKEVETGIVRYEQFQELYNTCQALNTKIETLAAIPADDKMFEQFSKTGQITGLKSNLTRWVEEYNAKSKMVNHSFWKSGSLPDQLTTVQFSGFTK